MKCIRWFLGRIILAVDFLTRPRPIIRDEKAQEAVDAQTAKMSLYQFEACPFCVKVRRHIRRNALNIQLRDAKPDGAFKTELVNEGGKHKVPCLRIDNGEKGVKWLYESDDICAYLNKEIGLP